MVLSSHWTWTKANNYCTEKKSENIYFGTDDCKLSESEWILSRSYLRFAKDKLRERKEMKRKDCSRLSHRRSRSRVGSVKSELGGG